MFFFFHLVMEKDGKDNLDGSVPIEEQKGVNKSANDNNDHNKNHNNNNTNRNHEFPYVVDLQSNSVDIDIILTEFTRSAHSLVVSLSTCV